MARLSSTVAYSLETGCADHKWWRNGNQSQTNRLDILKYCGAGGGYSVRSMEVTEGQEFKAQNLNIKLVLVNFWEVEGAGC